MAEDEPGRELEQFNAHWPTDMAGPGVSTESEALPPAAVSMNELWLSWWWRRCDMARRIPPLPSSSSSSDERMPSAEQRDGPPSPPLFRVCFLLLDRLFWNQIFT